jgi:hypothetical protein
MRIDVAPALRDGLVGGLGYPVPTTVARVARDLDGRGRHEREQDGTRQ